MSDRTTDRWMTYAQAADHLGLSPEAVRLRARRQGWRRMPGNDGRSLVLVPDRPDEQPIGRTTGRKADNEALREAVGVLREQLQAERTRADSERGRVEELHQQIAALQVQLAARQEVVDAAEATRQANDKRLALGRWARLRAAWRGK